MLLIKFILVLLFFHLNLGQTLFSQNNIKRGMLYNLSSGNQVLFKFSDWGNLTLDGIYTVEKDSFALLRDFSKKKTGKDFWMAGDGFFIGKGKNTKFYMLPDLKEIKN